MRDGELRDLERRWRATQSAEDWVAWAAACERGGDTAPIEFWRLLARRKAKPFDERVETALDHGWESVIAKLFVAAAGELGEAVREQDHRERKEREEKLLSSECGYCGHLAGRHHIDRVAYEDYWLITNCRDCGACPGFVMRSDGQIAPLDQAPLLGEAQLFGEIFNRWLPGYDNRGPEWDRSALVDRAREIERMRPVLFDTDAFEVRPTPPKPTVRQKRSRKRR